MRKPYAFTVVELLGALVLLAVGLAGFARAAAGVAALERDARLRRAVADAMLARLDTLAGAPCASAGGQAASDGVVERWSAIADSGMLVVADTLDVPARPRLTRAIVARVRCAP